MKNFVRKTIAFALTGAMVLSMAQWIRIPANAKEASMAVTEEEPVTEFMDCIEPMPIIGELSDECWGAAEVGARDQDNGLEDKTLQNYYYWDGGILKDEDTGTYYMFASRWDQSGGHYDWFSSQAIYAVSDNLYGPYTDMGPIWPDFAEGVGHNVFPFELSESDPLYEEGYRYGISVSDTKDQANGTIHISKSLDGPWELMDNGNDGKLNAKGGSGFRLSNVSIMVRPDGRYQATNRKGDIALADSVAGEWTVVENDLWKKVDGVSADHVEDPVIWYSDGLYHIVANKWDARMAYYLTSEDGITNWKKRQGVAYTPGADFLKYEDGTVNNWELLERPNVYMEDGKVVAMTFAALDVPKGDDKGDDQHGSKILVVPFSSEKLQQLDAQPDPLENRTGILPAADTTIQSYKAEMEKNYGAEEFLQMQKYPDYESYGNGYLGEGARPDDNEAYDNKISYVKYDLSQYDISEGDEIESAQLSLVYKNKEAGDAERTKIEAVLADSDWEEGTGCQSVNNNLTEGLTWETQPELFYDPENVEKTVVQSEEFNIADLQRVVELDVTELVRQFLEEHPQEKMISFAMNVTATGVRFRLYSREAGDNFAPRLIIRVKEPEEPTDPDLTLEEAIKKAQEAQEKAEMAQAAAEEAQRQAEQVQKEAQALKEKAETAISEAKKAQEAAEAAIAQAGEDSQVAREAMQEAIEKANEAEQAQIAAEEAQTAAETAKAHAEQKAVEAEEAKKEAKAERLAAEAAKKEAEAERLAAEEAKKEAEAERQAAEEAKREAEEAMQVAKEERRKAEEARKAAEAAKAEALKIKEELAKQQAAAGEKTEDTKEAKEIEKVSLKSVKRQKKGRLKVTWKQVEGATGYEILYSRNAKFKNAVTKKVGAKKTSLVLKKLKSKKKYYVKVRAVKKTQNGTVYGSYSKTKSQKVK